MTIKMKQNKGKNNTYNVYIDGKYVANFMYKKDAKAFKKYLQNKTRRENRLSIWIDKVLQ